MGRLYITLREAGYHPERNWRLREEGVTYQVDLAIPLGHKQWLPIVLAPDSAAPAHTLRFAPDGDPSQ